MAIPAKMKLSVRRSVQWDIVGKRSVLSAFGKTKGGEYGRSPLQGNEGAKKVGVSTAEGEMDGVNQENGVY